VIRLKELYLSIGKREKMTVSRAIVKQVRAMNPPGRFLERDPESGRYFDVGDKKAIEKTSQALRDGNGSSSAKKDVPVSSDTGAQDSAPLLVEGGSKKSQAGRQAEKPLKVRHSWKATSFTSLRSISCARCLHSRRV
jgi:hypothetical protein